MIKEKFFATPLAAPSDSLGTGCHASAGSTDPMPQVIQHLLSRTSTNWGLSLASMSRRSSAN